MSESWPHNNCPRCGGGAGPLRTWHELSEEEREVVRRLPASATQPLAERMARNRWCPRCWYETSNDHAQG